MYVCYNNNTHAMLEVNASLESPMQGLHSESLWRACCLGQHCVLIHTIVRKSLLKYCKSAPKAHLGGKGLKNYMSKYYSFQYDCFEGERGWLYGTRMETNVFVFTLFFLFPSLFSWYDIVQVPTNLWSRYTPFFLRARAHFLRKSKKHSIWLVSIWMVR